MTVLFFTFHGDLKELLTAAHQGGRLEHAIQRRASVKDVVESLGVPHTEIGTLAANGKAIDFTYCVTNGDRIEVMPPTPPVDVLSSSTLRPKPLKEIRLVADINVAKLGRLLRMAGFDTVCENQHNDAELAEIAAAGRILLTRDLRLLKRRKVVFGHLVRACEPYAQLREVIAFYGLADKIAPFSRCMLCNSELEPVAKAEIRHRLEPLTEKYYHEFHRCRGCDKLYWAGSHREQMDRVLADLAVQPAGSDRTL